MKAIYITDFYYFQTCGAKTSAHAHLKTLQKLYGRENIQVIALVGHKTYQYEPGHIIVEGTKNKLLLFAQCVMGYSTFLNSRNVKFIVGYISDFQPDFVFVDNSIFGILIREIKKCFPKLLVCTYYHDVKAKLGKDWLEQARWYRKPIYAAMINNEKITAQYTDINYTLNDRETQLYKKAYGKLPEAELPVYMDVPLPSYAGGTSEFARTAELRILFFSGYYLPNVHGIDWFIKYVFPALQNVKLYIAGRGMNRLQNQYHDPNIYIQGEVNDLEEPYGNADLIISPIFEGGGMKVKVAEAMAYGKIAVGTDESYEGYDQNIPDEYWGRFFFRANTPKEFINAIRSIQNEGQIKRYNPEIRRIYEQYYSEQFAEKVIWDSVEKYRGKTK